MRKKLGYIQKIRCKLDFWLLSDYLLHIYMYIYNGTCQMTKALLIYPTNIL